MVTFFYHTPAIEGKPLRRQKRHLFNCFLHCQNAAFSDVFPDNFREGTVKSGMRTVAHAVQGIRNYHGVWKPGYRIHILLGHGENDDSHLSLFLCQQVAAEISRLFVSGLGCGFPEILSCEPAVRLLRNGAKKNTLPAYGGHHVVPACMLPVDLPPQFFLSAFCLKLL